MTSVSLSPLQDMDEAANALMGMHGYCTQELVNLILAGMNPKLHNQTQSPL